ncbi:MAG: hypothetical protein U0793_33085 [Gemmataceae bacterium]
MSARHWTLLVGLLLAGDGRAADPDQPNRSAASLGAPVDVAPPAASASLRLVSKEEAPIRAALQAIGQPATPLVPEPAFSSPPAFRLPERPPHMIGDLFAFCVRQNLAVTRLTTVVTTTKTTVEDSELEIFKQSQTTTTTTTPLVDTVPVCNPYAFRLGYKIGDNASPLPLDRVYFTGAYLRTPFTPGFSLPASATGPTTTTTVKIDITTVTTTEVTTSSSTTGATVLGRRLTGNAEIFGFEKTFFDGYASLGVRLPIFQIHGDDGIGSDGIGDVSVLLKGIILGSPDGDYVLSSGLMVTAPAGGRIVTPLGDLNSTLLQPFVGGLWARGSFYAQFFTSTIVPTDSRDVALLVNSVGAGWVFSRPQATLVTWLAPTAEVHATTRLNHRGADEVIDVPDLINITGGLHIGIGRGAILTFGATTPVSGPRPFDIGAIAQLNWRF